MNKLKKYSKIVIFDTLAILCFIGVALFGWLPGPGGVPLTIAGLSLLAVNHDWAERWLETTKVKGMSIKNKVFPDNPAIKHAYDIGGTLLAALGLYLSFTADNRIFSAIGAIFTTISFTIILFNRKRLDKLSDLFKRNKH